MKRFPGPQRLEQAMNSSIYGHNCHSRNLRSIVVSVTGFYPTKTHSDIGGRNYYTVKLLFLKSFAYCSNGDTEQTYGRCGGNQLCTLS